MEKGIYIDGEWLKSEALTENINPSDLSDKIGTYAMGNSKHMDEAVEAAKRAQKIWALQPLEIKQQVLNNIGQTLMARSEELGRLLSREEGKPLVEGKGEVFRAGQFFTYYAAEIIRNHGETAQSVRSEVDVLVSREPVGVVGIISPWNFPMATAAWKIAPALAFGNSVIWKPANIVPASAVALTEIIAEQVNMPAGVFNLVVGSGSVAGQTMIEHPDVNAVSFTGSVEVGRRIAAATAVNFTRVQLEMGSKNALIIMEDADIDLAVRCAVNGAFGGTGQKCTASSRIIIHQDIYDQLVPKLIEATQALKVGHALSDDTQMGPLVDKPAYESIQKHCKEAVAQGGKILTGGQTVKCDTEGYFHSATLVDGLSNESSLNREELFTPLACLIRTTSYEEAVDMLNDTRFGLTGGIITKDLARAHNFMKRCRTGCVMVNLPTAGTDYHVPFGGRGESSYGPREQGRYAREFYTHVKTAYLSAGAPK